METNTAMQTPVEATTHETNSMPEEYKTDADHTALPVEVAPVCALGVLGIIGNGLILIVLLKYEEYRNRLGNILVIHQSFVDIIASLVCMLTYISKSKEKSYDGWAVLYCWLLDSEIPMWSMLNLSSCNLMAITIERYIMIVFPVFYQSNITFKVIMADIVALWVIALTEVGGFGYPFSGVLDGVCYLQYFWPNSLLPRVHSTLYLIFHLFLPVFMFIICYSHMIHNIRKRQKISTEWARSNKSRLT